MPFIYDNLIATVISMTVFLILFSIQAEATQNNTARTSRHIAKSRAANFITWLEEDLVKMGKNMGSGATAFQTPTDSTQWHTERFVFSFLNSSGDTVRTRYDLEQTGTRTVEGEQQKIFTIERSRKVGTGSWTSKGQGPSSLGYFEVDVLDKNADSTATATRAEFIRVQFSVVGPFQGERTFLHRVHRSTVVPYRLARR